MRDGVEGVGWPGLASVGEGRRQQWPAVVRARDRIACVTKLELPPALVVAAKLMWSILLVSFIGRTILKKLRRFDRNYNMIFASPADRLPLRPRRFRGC